MLSQIKVFFERQPIANLQQIADALGVDADAVRGMLTVWMNKGCVRCLSQPGPDGCHSGGCGSCVTGCGSFGTAAV